MKRHPWFVVVAAGSGPRPARGPFVSLAGARASVAKFRQKLGSIADSWITVGDVRIYEYERRVDAMKADISDTTENHPLIAGEKK